MRVVKRERLLAGGATDRRGRGRGGNWLWQYINAPRVGENFPGAGFAAGYEQEFSGFFVALAGGGGDEHAAFTSEAGDVSEDAGVGGIEFDVA